jgi:hypothetical protein
MTQPEILTLIASVLSGDAHPDDLSGIPVDSIPPSYRLAYEKIVEDAQEHGTVDADRILGRGNGEAEPLREIFTNCSHKRKRRRRRLLSSTVVPHYRPHGRS